MNWLEMIWVGIITLLVLAFSCGCSEFMPCTYGGKAVSQRDANNMKALGMGVTCPGDESQLIPCDENNCGKKPC